MVGKRGRRFQFNFSNRFLYTFIAIAVVISLGVIVYALNTNLGYHPIDQIQAPAGCTLGQVLSWTGSAWVCIDSAGGGPSGSALIQNTTLYQIGICSVSYYGQCTVTLGGGNLVSTTQTSSFTGGCTDYNGVYRTLSCTTTNTPIGYSVMPTTSTTYSFYAGYDPGSSVAPHGWTAPTGAQIDLTSCYSTADEIYTQVTSGQWLTLIDSNRNPNGDPSGLFMLVSVEDAGGCGCDGSGGGGVDCSSVNYKITYKVY